MSKSTNSGMDSDVVVKGLASLRSFAFAQVLASVIMVSISFFMLFFSGINLIAVIIAFSLLLAFILRSLRVFANLSVAIDSFRKFRHKHFRLSCTLLMPILERKLLIKILIVFFLFSFLIISALFLMGGGMALTLLSAVLGSLMLFMAAFHVGVLTFLWGLRDALEDSVFQLASVLIAVPFCTNLIPGIIGLLALFIGQLFFQQKFLFLCFRCGARLRVSLLLISLRGCL